MSPLLEPARGLNTALCVMAGLVPAIHAAPFPGRPEASRLPDDVDDRDKPGHDDGGSDPSAYAAEAADSAS